VQTVLVFEEKESRLYGGFLLFI